MSPILSVISIVIVSKVVCKVNIDIAIVSFMIGFVNTNPWQLLSILIEKNIFIFKIPTYMGTVTLMIIHPYIGLYYKHMMIISDL
jgi:hypothetical protein